MVQPTNQVTCLILYVYQAHLDSHKLRYYIVDKSVAITSVALIVTGVHGPG